MIHGKKRSGAEKEAYQRFSPDNAASNPSSHRVVNPSHHDGQNSMQIKEQDNRASKRVALNRPGISSRKRKAIAPLSQGSARRQRSNTTELQDEAFVRSTMRIPTPEEYPDAPAGFFEDPKQHIFGLAHGQQVAKCRSQFTSAKKDAYQCTAYFNSSMHTEVAIGEGRNQAGRSVS